MNLENFIVIKRDGENYEIQENVERETITGEKVIVREPRGIYNLPGLYGDKSTLMQRLSEVNEVIDIIEKNNQQ